MTGSSLSAAADAAVSLAHPRIEQRRAAVADAAQRVRHRRLLAGVAVAVLGLLAYGVTQSPLLDVDEVRVIGADRTGANALRDAARIEPGTPLVGLDLERVLARVTALPSVAAAGIERDWSGQVTIEVTERRPAARIASPDGVIVAAADGMVIEIVDTADPGLPEISGAMVNLHVGSRVPGELAEAVAVAAALPNDLGRLVERIELTVDQLGLRLDGGGFVALGDARELEAKFDALRAVLAQVELGCLEQIDVQAPLVPVLARSSQCW